MKITPSKIEYLTHGLGWSKACYHSERDYMNCLFCYMQRFRDPKKKPDPNEGRAFWLNDEIGELIRQLKRGFVPKGNWMMCTSHDPLSDHSYKTCYEVLMVLRSFRKVTPNMHFLSKFLNRIIPVAASEMMPKNALYGATITTLSQLEAESYSPGTYTPMKQIEALNSLHALGYRTWVSLEPCFSYMRIPRLLTMIPNIELVVIGKHNKVSSDPHKYEVLSKDQFKKQIAEARRKFPDTRFYIKKELKRWLNAKKKR